MADMAMATVTATAMAMPRTSSEADRHLIRSLKRFLPLSALIAVPASAAQWHVSSFLSVDQTYSDNIALAPRGQERSEWVTQVRPAFTFTYSGPKLQFDATYILEFLYFANAGETSVRHQLTGGMGGATNASWEVVPGFLFLDTSVGVSQRTESLLGPQTQLAASQPPGAGVFAPRAQREQVLTSINADLAGNTTTAVTGYASPYIKQKFGEDAIFTARYTYSLVASTSGGVANADSGANRLEARLESGPSYRRTRWYVQYYKDLINYSGTASDTTFEQLTAGGQHLIWDNLYLIASVGYDNNTYDTASGNRTSGEFWNAGVNWTPTPRTNLNATYGHRYYGPNWNFNFSHRTRLLFINASYFEEITTQRSRLLQPLPFSTAATLNSILLGSIPDPVARQQAVQNLITQGNLPTTLFVPVEFFTTDVFLSKTFQGSVGLNGARHSLFANFYSGTRESQQSASSAVGDFATSTTIKQRGVSGNWNWRITQYDSTNFTLGVARNEFPSIGREDDITYFYWTYNHQFSPKLNGAFTYRRLNSQSKQPCFGKSTENAAIASLRFTF